MGYPEFRVIEEALGWDPAEVKVPPMPYNAVGAPAVDPLSLLAGAVMPKYASDVAEPVAEARAREERFAGNLRSARSAYHGTDAVGKDQINGAVADLDPAGAFGAGEPEATSSALSTSDAGLSQLTQLMGTAMQGTQQAAQVPMQTVGTVGQMVEPLIQGIYGVVQLGTQSSAESDAGGSGNGGQPNAATATPDGGRGSSANDPEDNGDRDDAPSEGRDGKDQVKESDEAKARSEVGRSAQPPVGTPRPDLLEPGSLSPPTRQRMTNSAPEVEL